MDHSTAADGSLPAWLWLFRQLFFLATPAVLTLVAHYRPSWLLRAWLATWLVPVAIWDPDDLEYAPLAAVVMGVATGLPAIWLHVGRRHPVFSRLAAQFFGAVVAFVGGILLAVLVLAMGS